MVPHLRGVVENASLAAVAGDGLDDVFERLARQVSAVDQLVQVDDVGVVVLAVVKRQGVGSDVGCQRVVGERKRGKFDGHFRSSQQGSQRDYSAG